MTICEHVLLGCAPVPLAGYLKALGLFRLVAEQADEQARAFWRDERFVLQTKLSEDELVEFFAKQYEPSPIISPWNGRAGFLEGGSEESGEESSREGAELIRRYETAGRRFHKLRYAVESYRSLAIIGELDRARATAKPLQELKRKKIRLDESQKKQLQELEAAIKQYKVSAISSLRSDAPDSAVEWFDACQRIAVENVAMPLLGSGGNDGSRDFGMNFGTALETLFELSTGRPLANTVSLVRESLGFGLLCNLGSGNLGQYEPGSSGENTTSGFQGGQPFNPANLIFLLEGAILFSGTTTRRLGSERVRLSFPFTAIALTAGSGATTSGDDKNLAEFWAPIWTRPANFGELKSLLAEGRVAIDGKTAKDGLEFAIAVHSLGSQRGVPEFQRFALLQREPRNPKKATPLGRVRARENPRASLTYELSANGWLTRVRGGLRGSGAPTALVALGRSLDEALFRIASDGSAEAVQNALIAIGKLMREAARRPKLRQSDKGFPPLPPCPRLSSEWAEAANDGSHEFALAEALASLDANAEGFRMPFRRHLAPLVWPKGREGWGDTTEATTLVVWTGRDLVSDMVDLLQRRLMEAHRHRFVDRNGRDELPLRGWRAAPLSAVCAFLAGTTDDTRTSGLAAGLAWARSRGGEFTTTVREQEIPFAYAALKPIFVPRPTNAVQDECRIVDPLPIVRLAGTDRITDAIGKAQKMARISGFATPFLQVTAAKPSDSRRVLAALAFPLTPKAELSLLSRAYPDDTKEEEVSHAA